MTARILGWELGLARTVGAVVFSVVIGLTMHFIYIKEEKERQQGKGFQFGETREERPPWKNILYFSCIWHLPQR